MCSKTYAKHCRNIASRGGGYFFATKKKKKIGTQYITGRQNVVDGNGLKLRDEQLIARIVEGVAVGMQMLLNDFKKSFLFQ